LGLKTLQRLAARCPSAYTYALRFLPSVMLAMLKLVQPTCFY